MKNYISSLLYFFFVGTLFGQNNQCSFDTLVEPNTQNPVEVAESLMPNNEHADPSVWLDDSSFVEQWQIGREDFSFPFDFEITIVIDTNLHTAQIINGTMITMFVAKEVEWEDKIIFEEGAMAQGIVHHSFGTTLYILPLFIQSQSGQNISVSGPLIECELEGTDTETLLHLEARGSCFITKK